MGSQSLELVSDLVKFEVFKEIVDQAHKILLPLGFSVYDLFYKCDENTFKCINNVTITILIVQVYKHNKNKNNMNYSMYIIDLNINSTFRLDL